MKTREQWLLEATEKLRVIFESSGIPLPEKIRVSCGWPSRGGTKTNNRVIGQCWSAEASKDGYTQIFISPYIESGYESLEVLTHELIHAARPEARHGSEFKSAMGLIGLIGKATATKAGDDLKPHLETIAEELGLYDNGKIDPNAKSADAPPKQKNRQLKIACTKKDRHDDGEDYILRGAKKTLARGVPDCPLCGEELVQEKDDEDTETEDVE